MAALAQGQRAVEGKLNYWNKYNDTIRIVEDGYTPGAYIGYFLTCDLSLNLTYTNDDHTRSNKGTSHHKIERDQFGLNAQSTSTTLTKLCVITFKVVVSTGAFYR